MSRFGHESPMEFEFQNGTGPLDGRSPFAQVSANARRFGEGVNSSPRKRPQNAFGSPSKLRPMGAQQSSPSKAIPAYNGLFNTPRKSQQDIDDSSAGETPRSPEPKDDSDATPEVTNPRNALTRYESAEAQTLPGAERERGSPSKQRLEPYRRESFMVSLATKFKKIASPGRGEVPRNDHSGAIEKVARRRKREVDRRVARRRRHSMSDSGEDNEQPPKSPRKTSGAFPALEEKKQHWASSFFTFIAQHPGLPQTLSLYAQFVFNIFLLCCCAYLIYCFWSAVLGDVDRKSHEAMADIMSDMKRCLRDYEHNNCDNPIPVAEKMCAEWKKCMTVDPENVPRARVSAHTFADIFNSFVEPISYKAMLFTAILVFGCFGISNFAFGIFRSKVQQYQPNYGYGYPYGPPPPPTPQRSFSGQDGGFYPGTPWHQPLPGMGYEPQPSGGYGQIEGQGSPVRRLGF